MGGNPATYTYNNLTGALSITSVTGNVVITATAEAKLAAPIIDLTGSILAWTTVDNATVYSIRSNGTEVARKQVRTLYKLLIQHRITLEDVWSSMSSRIDYFNNYNDYRENITMTIQTQHPYIDEEQIIYEELIKT